MYIPLLLIYFCILIFILYEFIKYGILECVLHRELFFQNIFNIINIILLCILFVFLNKKKDLQFHVYMILILIFGVNIYSIYNFYESKLYIFNNYNCNYEYYLSSYIISFLSCIILYLFCIYVNSSILSIILICIGKIGEIIYDFNINRLNLINRNRNNNNEIFITKHKEFVLPPDSDSEIFDLTNLDDQEEANLL